MILNMLNEILSKQMKKVDKTVYYDLNILSQKLMDCLAKHFVLTDGFRLEKIDMMTFEQIVRAFEKQYPPYSLLFSTEKSNYFAFCVRQ